ncbi:hypothetical protein [Paraburkholderia fungorum]|uniref:Uncharacterized protein n=1 Tax=Paraburkholderia fungorum TaxID=134537 RepID=A0AAW3V3P5_9BURK|nr:hypothetical protein [Paraburkholderia fungorum]MBB4515838.1 hypothetical protein [Paraburkholderia fungorum]MBB6203746.1 hypothetical protein [Paraburkholderia fungorum]
MGYIESGSHNFAILKEEILSRSNSKVWESAVGEWDLDHIFTIERNEEGGGVIGHGYGVCLCSHQPIVEHCVLKNQANGNEAIVGNVCVKRFMGIDYSLLFDGVSRIRKDIKKAANSALIQFVHARGEITDWELGFLSDTKSKRMLSAKQRAARQRINRKILVYLDDCAIDAQKKSRD